MSPYPLTPDALPYLFKIFRLGLSTLVLGNVEKPSSTLVAELSRSFIISPNRIKQLKKQPYLSLEWMSHRLENLFATHTLVNGDVKLSYGMNSPKGPVFFKTTLIGPDLDAMRDVTLHWEIIKYLWEQFPQARPLDPFAAELLSERISEFLLFYLRLAKKFHPNKKSGKLTSSDLKVLTRIASHMKFIRTMPPQFKWGSRLQQKKKALFSHYKSPLFASITKQSGIKTKPCNAHKAHLYLGKYAFIQKQSFYYIPRTHQPLVDRRAIAQKNLSSRKKDIQYPGLMLWNGPGIAVGDYNNDGKPDLFFSGEGCNRLYQNLGHYKFRDVTKKVGLNDPHYDSHHALFADINNDGRLDLLVLHGMRPSRLYLQTRHGRFVDITKTSGIKTTIGANTAVFFDYDNDGKLDLYIGYFGSQYLYERQLPSINGRNGRPNQLYHNLGGGRFKKMTLRSGLGSTGWAMALAALDVNQDGFLDLFVANDFGPDELFINQGNGTFQEVAQKWGVSDRTNGMNISYTDFNYDGRWDLYVSVIDMFSKELRFILPRGKDLIQIDERILRSSFYLSGNKFYVSGSIKDFYRSREQHHFEPGERGWTWSGIFFDYENDGDEDFYLTNGWSPQSFADNQTNLFFLRSGQQFFLYQKDPSLSYRGNSRSSVAVDLTGSGRMDLILNDYQTGPRILRNRQKGKNHWLKVKLRGKHNNSFGVGAKIRLWVKTLPIQMRQISAGSNYMSQDPTIATFGLGSQKQAEKLVVFWPGGRKQVVPGPFQSGQTILVKEKE